MEAFGQRDGAHDPGITVDDHKYWAKDEDDENKAK